MRGRLALSLVRGETLLVGKDVQITYKGKGSRGGANIRLLVEAPKEIKITREKKSEKKLP